MMSSAPSAEVAATQSSDRTQATLIPASLWHLMQVLTAICALAILFHIYVDHSGQYLTRVYLERYYAGYMSRLMAEKPFWYFLLPMPDIKGVWATTGFVPIYFLEISIGPHATFLVLTTCATAAFGIGCWLILRRTWASALAAFALAFSPFNDSVYLWNGSNNAYVTVTFLSLSLGFFGAYVLHEGRRSQLILGTVFLVLGALSYEIWLNAAVIAALAAPPIVIFCRRFGRPVMARRYLSVLAIMLVVAIVYTVVRVQTLRNTAVPGLEFQMIWDGGSFGATLDDFVYNVVFLFYLAVSQLLPGFAGASLAIQEAGRLDISALQGGYQPELYPVVAAHYLNLWLVYAGALFAGVTIATVLWLRRAVRDGSVGYLVAGLFALALIVGSPTHAVLKFVAFNGVPFYSYKSTIGVMVLLVALAVVLTNIEKRTAALASRPAITIVVIAYVLLVVFTRPVWVNENVLEIWGEQGFFGNGFYPDRWRNLKTLVGTIS